MDSILPWEIVSAFINFCDGKQNDPQFWIFINSGIIGWMITVATIVDKKSTCFIRQAYIDANHRGNGVMGISLDVLTNKVKDAGFERILCQRYGDATVFSRLMRKYGYRYKATEFEKEI